MPACRNHELTAQGCGFFAMTTCVTWKIWDLRRSGDFMMLFHDFGWWCFFSVYVENPSKQRWMLQDVQKNKHLSRFSDVQIIRSPERLLSFSTARVRLKVGGRAIRCFPWKGEKTQQWCVETPKMDIGYQFWVIVFVCMAMDVKKMFVRIYYIMLI